MNQEQKNNRKGERGSALIVTVIVSVILSLLGISFMMMADTENQIAQNEIRSAQALFVAESGVRMVKRWFDRPFDNVNNIRNPSFGGEIDLALRLIETDGDPGTVPVAQDGGATYPRYKQGIDLDANGSDDLFKKPYRGSTADALMGTEAGPDMQILATSSAAAATFLDNLSSDIFGSYPGGGLQAKIVEIDIYGPPYISIAGTWIRYGMATVKVIARITQTLAGNETVLAERMVKAVINEMPYPGPFGPLHSCDNLSFNGDFTVNWGAASAVADANITNNHDKIQASWPRVTPPGQRVDALWTADFAGYMTEVDGEEIDDPWFRFLAGGAIADAPNTNPQPEPFGWVAGAPGDGEWPNHVNSPDDGTHSNIFQNQPTVTCPDFDYEVWKAIATSGGSDVHYMVWDNGSSFKENGIGTAQTFRALTDQNEGLYFFDTTDGIAPYDAGGDGTYDNLTPAISIGGGTWGSRGFFYLNTLEFQTKGITGRAATFNAPGEPWSDTDADGVYDAGEPYINLAYPTGALTDPYVIDTTDAFGGAVMRNGRGPDVAGTAAMWGILFTNGDFSATGNATFYGSVIGKSGVGEASPAAGTPQLYWDESILTDWPPATWDLPRVIISRWETDL